MAVNGFQQLMKDHDESGQYQVGKRGGAEQHGALGRDMKARNEGGKGKGIADSQAGVHREDNDVGELQGHSGETPAGGIEKQNRDAPLNQDEDRNQESIEEMEQSIPL